MLQIHILNLGIVESLSSLYIFRWIWFNYLMVSVWVPRSGNLLVIITIWIDQKNISKSENWMGTSLNNLWDPQVAMGLNIHNLYVNSHVNFWSCRHLNLQFLGLNFAILGSNNYHTFKYVWYIYFQYFILYMYMNTFSKNNGWFSFYSQASNLSPTLGIFYLKLNSWSLFQIRFLSIINTVATLALI